MTNGAVDTELSKADLRRAQVLDAAVLCFGRSGFHGASMADIAAEASMSVGQIYRYFANKEAIIASIVARDMEEAGARFAEIRARRADPAEELIEAVRYRMSQLEDPIRRALALEILAEAARNPGVAEIVRAAEETGRGWLRELFMRNTKAADACFEGRLDAVAALIEGWTSRMVRNPEADREAYLASLREMLQRLITQCGGAVCAD